MTAREIERLAVVETKIRSIESDVAEIKTDLKSVLESLEKQEQRFITKSAVRWTVTILVAIVAALGTFIQAVWRHR